MRQGRTVLPVGLVAGCVLTAGVVGTATAAPGGTDPAPPVVRAGTVQGHASADLPDLPGGRLLPELSRRGLPHDVMPRVRPERPGPVRMPHVQPEGRPVPMPDVGPPGTWGGPSLRPAPDDDVLPGELESPVETPLP